jgi:hypothetical protein
MTEERAAHLITARKQKAREIERRQGKTHPSKKCLQNLLSPTRPHLLK